MEALLDVAIRLPEPLKRAAAQVYQRSWSLWARQRYKSEFDRVQRFCLFAGYPRSGHSLVGALLNAHRNAVISHELSAHLLILQGCTREQLYAEILARASWFNFTGNRGTYPYQIPNQWQGRFEELQVIGDKRGGGLARHLVAHPDLLPRVRELVGVPLRLVHVVRNPFDNISAISIWNRMSLADAIERYFLLCGAMAKLTWLEEAGEMITIYHEDVIRQPRPVLAHLCSFLGLDLYPGYLEDCCSIVFRSPTYSRRRIDWPPAAVREVEERARRFRFLDGYRFEIPGDRPPFEAMGR
jgi:hypothetical protein